MRNLLAISFLFFIVSSPLKAIEKNILSELNCTTTIEKTIYSDGSKNNIFRSSEHSIKNAKISIYDIEKFKNKLFVKFDSPYTDNSKKIHGFGDFENVIFEIKFNSPLYLKEEFSDESFTANFGNYIVMV